MPFVVSQLDQSYVTDTLLRNRSVVSRKSSLEQVEKEVRELFDLAADVVISDELMEHLMIDLSLQARDTGEDRLTYPEYVLLLFEEKRNREQVKGVVRPYRFV
jgi:hypothetical protein